MKIIAGLSNLCLNQVIDIVSAADIVSSTYLDIAANINIIKEVKKYTHLPICVSSISLSDLYDCAVEGVDFIEIGNYDYFYQQSIAFSSSHIFSLAKEAVRMLPELDICVTIPSILPLDEQVNLSIKLENIGVQMIQTESLNTRIVKENVHVTTLVKSALPVLLSTYVISRAVKIPIITSSGINSILASLACTYGASGVGIGTSVKNYTNILMKSIYIREVTDSINKKKIVSFSNKFSSVKSLKKLIV